MATMTRPRGGIPLPLLVGVLASAFLFTGAQPALGFGFITKWGSYGARHGQFTRVIDVATDRAGNVYAIDPRDRVQKFTSRGDFILQWGTRGNGKGEFDGVSGIAIDRAGNVYVVERRNDRVQKFTFRGKFLSAWVTPAVARVASTARPPSRSIAPAVSTSSTPATIESRSSPRREGSSLSGGARAAVPVSSSFPTGSPPTSTATSTSRTRAW